MGLRAALDDIDTPAAITRDFLADRNLTPFLVVDTPGSSLQYEEWFQSDGSAFANANRLVAKVGGTALQDGMGIRPRSGTENTIRSTLYAVCRGDGVDGAHHALERPVSPTYLSPIVR
jgi:hypothetical protein